MSMPVFQSGQTVAGRYRILRYINRGGMGEVYEAWDLDLELGAAGRRPGIRLNSFGPPKWRESCEPLRLTLLDNGNGPLSVSGTAP